MASVSQTMIPPWVRRGTRNGGREKQKLRPRRRVVERDDPLLEIELRHPAQQPAAQGPRGIVAAADRKRGLGHAISPCGGSKRWAAGLIVAEQEPHQPRPVRHGVARNARDTRTRSCFISPTSAKPTFCSWSATAARLGAFGASRLWDRLTGASAAVRRGLRARLARAGLTPSRPAFGIHTVPVGNREVPVTEEAVSATPFGTLLRFSKDIATAQPRVLVVAPLSGHFATLLRGTVRTLLADHDVYITDWHNARDVSRSRPGASASTTTSTTSSASSKTIGPGAHVLAVCQPCVQVLAAVGADGAGREPGAAAQHDPDGRAGRRARQPDQGERTRHEQADRPGSSGT